MKTSFLIATLCFVVSLKANAQKIDLEKWVINIVDSLKKNRVDTIEYYHAYCGECFVKRNPKDTLGKRSCEVESSLTQINNTILYKQSGSYYSLAFNCGFPPIKKKLNSCRSVECFISIIPLLNKRDRTVKALYKHNNFFAPIVEDGGYEEVALYFHNIKQSASLQDYQRTDKTWQSFFWIKKQIHLFDLVESDLSTN